jgi:hypothetical protein
VAILFAENLDKTEEGVQRSWNSYQRLFYDNGFVNVEDLKKIRNEMDLLDIGVRKRYALCLLQSASRPSAICKQVFCLLPAAFCLGLLSSGRCISASASPGSSAGCCRDRQLCFTQTAPFYPDKLLKLGGCSISNF